MSEPRRALGTATAALLVVASMVGTGVFTTAGFMVRDLGDPRAVLLGWVVGGLIALTGALSYGELTAALPVSGGEYALLSRIYHPFVGFLGGWVSFLVGFSAPAAASAMAFASYLGAVAPWVPETATAVGLLAALSLVHALRVDLSAGVQNVLTAGKLTLVVGVAALLLAAGDPLRALMPEGVGGAMGAGLGSGAGATGLGSGAGAMAGALDGGAPSLLAILLGPAFAVSLIYVTFAYSGWNAAAYVAGEVRAPGRSLPRALLAGTGIVTVLYLALNLGFLAAAPLTELSGVVEVGHVALAHALGPAAADVLSLVIALALVSSVGALVVTGPRVYEAMGRDHPRLRRLVRRSAGRGPGAAIALQLVASSIMVLTASFDALLTYIGVTLSLSSGLTVAGVLVLRRKRPDLPRPYLVPGHPVTPLVFVAFMLWIVVHTFVQRPLSALAAAGTLALGALLWWWARDRSVPARPEVD